MMPRPTGGLTNYGDGSQRGAESVSFGKWSQCPLMRDLGNADQMGGRV